MRDRQRLSDALDAYHGLARELADQQELIELGEAEGDEAVVAEAEAAIRGLRDQAAQREIEALLDGEADGNDTFLEVNAGAGGTESCDWAAMLARMYVRWAEAHGMKVELVAESAGEEAGIRSVTYKIIGPNAYGWLKTGVGGASAGADLAVRFRGAAAHVVFVGLGLSGGGRQYRDRDRAERHPHRHLSLVGRRRAACEHHGFGGADHPLADQHRGDELGEVAAPEPGERDGGFEVEALRAGVEDAERGDHRAARGQGRRRLGQPDPRPTCCSRTRW